MRLIKSLLLVSVTMCGGGCGAAVRAVEEPTPWLEDADATAFHEAMAQGDIRAARRIACPAHMQPPITSALSKEVLQTLAAVAPSDPALLRHLEIAVCAQIRHARTFVEVKRGRRTMGQRTGRAPLHFRWNVTTAPYTAAIDRLCLGALDSCTAGKPRGERERCAVSGCQPEPLPDTCCSIYTQCWRYMSRNGMNTTRAVGLLNGTRPRPPWQEQWPEGHWNGTLRRFLADSLSLKAIKALAATDPSESREPIPEHWR